MPVLSTWTPEDAILGAVAPLGLAAAAGTCLVVDLDRHGVALPGELTLAELVDRGPSQRELVPSRRGVAVLPNGGVDGDDAAEVIGALVASWPHVVVRLPMARPEGFGSVVPVALGGRARPPVGVVQRLHRFDRSRGRVTLPPLRRATIRSLLEGRAPVPVAWRLAWRRVWGLSWT